MNAKEIIEKGLIASATKTTRAIPQIQSLSEVFGKQINEIATNIRAINNDTSRTRSEKASLYGKVSGKLNKELSGTLGKMVESLHSETDLHNHIKESALKSGDKYTNLHLATHLRDNKELAHELLMSDLRYAQAASEFPASYFGLKQSEMVKVQSDSLLKNMPDLAAKDEELKNSSDHLGRLVRYYDGLNMEVSMLTDDIAMANRVNETDL